MFCTVMLYKHRNEFYSGTLKIWHHVYGQILIKSYISSPGVIKKILQHSGSTSLAQRGFSLSSFSSLIIPLLWWIPVNLRLIRFVLLSLKTQQAENNSRDMASLSPVFSHASKNIQQEKPIIFEGFAQVTLKIVNNGYFWSLFLHYTQCLAKNASISCGN